MEGKKKLTAALVAVVIAITTRIGFDVSDETAAIIVAPIVAYILAQGRADQGKEAEKVKR